MAVLEYCEECKRETAHDDIGNVGCYKCEQRRKQRLHKKARLQFEKLSVEQQVMCLWEQLNPKP